MLSPFLTRPLPKQVTGLLKTDPQAKLVYKMEREFVGVSVYHKVDRQHLLLVMNHVCKYYKVAVPKLIIYNKPKERIFGSSSSVVFDDGTGAYDIRLNRGFHGANLCTLLHELAHHICDSYYENHEDHGKEFCGIYMHLLEKYRVMPSCAFRAMAKRWGIRIAKKFKPEALVS